jgi:hypothetical protein
MGTSCSTAGAFLAIRSLLHDAGADVHAVAPSTPLKEYTRHYAGVFLGPISSLAPNSLPEVTIRTPEYDKACQVFAISCLLAILGFAMSWAADIPGEILSVFGVTLGVISWISIAIIARDVPPSEVTFGNLETFRDLATVIAGSCKAAG